MHGVLQARILEWVATHFSRGSCWPRDQTQVSWVSCIGRKFITASAAWETQRRMVLAQNQTGTSMEQIESPEIKPHLNGQLIYGKWSKSTQWGKDKLFSKWCWENRTTACKIIHSDCSHTPYTKINPQWGGGIRPETTELVGENISCMFSNIGLAIISLNLSPQVRETKAKISKWDSVKLKSFFAVKETINKL